MRKIALHWWIIIGVLAGALLGTALYWLHIDGAREAVLGAAYTPAELAAHTPEVAAQLRNELAGTLVYPAIDGIGELFLKLLKMIVIPLVFFSLVAGIGGLGNMRRLGRIGAKTFGLYIVTSLLAIITGLVAVNVIRPGDGMNSAIPLAAEAPPLPESFWQVLLNMVPDNVVAAAANFDLVGVILFALLFGGCLLTVDEARRRPMLAFIDAGAEVMIRMTHVVIALAPIGVAALIARMVATTGPEIFAGMLRYVMTIMLTLGFHLLVTLPAVIYVLTRRNPYCYLRAMLPALLTGFSTASSSGTLAVTMERAERGAGVSKKITSFVLPLGATINMDGTALFEIVSVIFIAQLHASVDPEFTLTFGSQLLIVFLGLMVSIGAAGIPHAGLVMMVIILQAVGLPVAYSALIWTVDRLLDMSRTAVNIASDSSIALIVAHHENEIDESILFGGRPESDAGDTRT